MNSKLRHYFGLTGALLALTVLMAGQVPAATALGTYQESPAARVLQGSGVFPRLVVAAPAR